MSIFGVTRYGAGLYGVDEDTTLLVWALEVAWDGTYHGDNEAANLIDVTLARGRKVWVGDKGFNPIDDCDVTVVLRDDDQRYSPFNVAGALHPYVRPGPLVRLWLVDGRGGTEYPVMRGYIDDIQNYTKNSERFARVTLKGGFQWLRDKRAMLPYSAGSTTGALVTALLNAVGWPTAEWPLSLAAATATVAHYWGYDGDALSEIQRLMQVGGNPLYIQRDGTLRALAGWTTYEDPGSPIRIEQNECLRDINLGQPWLSMRNRAEVAVYPATTQNVTATLWTGSVPVKIGIGEVVYYRPKYSYGAYTSIIPETIVAGDFDFEAWTVEDGSGIEITGSCELWDLRASEGDNLWAIYNASAYNGYVTKVNVTGTFDIWVNQNEPAWLISNGDATRQALYGRRVVKLDNPWQQDADIATDRADEIITALDRYLISEPTIELEARPALQFGIEPYGSAVILSLPALGIDPDAIGATTISFRAAHVRHRWVNQTGLAVRTILKMESLIEDV